MYPRVHPSPFSIHLLDLLLDHQQLDRRALFGQPLASTAMLALRRVEQGLAVGLQQNSSEMLSLTIAVIVHEAIMSFR